MSYYAEIVPTSQHRTQNAKAHNRTTQGSSTLVYVAVADLGTLRHWPQGSSTLVYVAVADLGTLLHWPQGSSTLVYVAVADIGKST
jgi:hypothetical protein